MTTTTKPGVLDRDGFKARSGCFACVMCGRQTRITSKHSHHGSEMCQECDEVSMIENAINDCGDPDGSQQARINELNQAAVNRGGVIAGFARNGGAA